MGTKRTRDLPARLESLRRRFERWRRSRKVRTRIPEPLWASAVKVADRFGIHRTAKVLRVDYYALKERVEQNAVSGGTQRGPAATASKVVAEAEFLELPAAAWPGSGECTLELEDADGGEAAGPFEGLRGA